MSLKSTLVPALYFTGALTFGTLGIRDAKETGTNIEDYIVMKRVLENIIMDKRKEAQYQAFMARDDIYWYGGKTALEFFLAGIFATMWNKGGREE